MYRETTRINDQKNIRLNEGKEKTCLCPCQNNYQHSGHNFKEGVDLRSGDHYGLIFNARNTMFEHTNEYSNCYNLKNYKSSRTTFNEELMVKFVNFL
jgi:hypothetical protein